MNGPRWFLVGGLLVCLVLAGLVSGYASSSPDGLEHAAREGCTVDEQGEITGGSCMAQAEQEHDLAGGWLADYGIRGAGNERLATGLSGVAGVLVTFAIGGGLFWLVRRRRPATPAETE
jgi:cobalt/nickel transport protein